MRAGLRPYLGPRHEQAIGLPRRQRPQQDALHEREHGRRRGRGDAEREDGRGGQRPRPPETAHGDPQVVETPLEEKIATAPRRPADAPRIRRLRV